jgi:hypothetical protein
MNIDFHYGVIYVISRLAGLPPNQAEIVAHSCQYVDDATVHGVLQFAGGQSYERFASAHKMLDYKNELNTEDKVVWAPFHFLPGGEGESLDDKAVCRPDSAIAKEMVKRALSNPHAENALHRLGISLHVYVDTWAHQGFAGIRSDRNLITYLNGDDHDATTWLEKLEGFARAAGETGAAFSFDVLSRLGHGAALHFPDMPWATWEYKDATGRHIYRKNLPDFVAAADMACRVVQAFVAGQTQYANEEGLSASQKAQLEALFASNRSHDEIERLSVVCASAEQGTIEGFMEPVPPYIAKGEGSWKYQATGIAAADDGNTPPTWGPVFEDSEYRRFHDALKEHRFEVTQEILPSFGIRLA